MKTQPSEREIIKIRQRAWAARNGLGFDADGYCACADDNIFRGLSPGARKDFESGDGSELGKKGKRGKIQALHSSSALACNWFDYWRGRDLQTLSRAFGVPIGFSTLAIERKFPTGLGRHPSEPRRVPNGRRRDGVRNRKQIRGAIHEVKRARPI